jgi:hypothetical protein
MEGKGVNEDLLRDQNHNNNENISLDLPDSSKYCNKLHSLAGLDGEKSTSVKPPTITTSVSMITCAS